MASQPMEESRLSRIVNGSSIWISVIVILVYAVLCVTSTTIYAFRLTLSPRTHLIITIVWGVANTLGGALLAMTVYGWAQLIFRKQRRQTSTAETIVSGEKAIAKQIADAAKHLVPTPTAHHGAQSAASGGIHLAAPGQGATVTQPSIGLSSAMRASGGAAARGGVASVVARTTLLVASGILVAAAVAPQRALDIYNQPPPTHSVSLDAVLALAQTSPTPSAPPSAPATPPPTSVALPVMKSAFISTGRRCGDVATDIAWTLTNTATTQAGKPEAMAVNWVAFVGDTRFTATPNSGQVAPNQTITVHVRGPTLPAGNGLYLSLYVTDKALDYTDITNAVTCVRQ